LIVSVLYRWEAGACGEHIHDLVDEKKLREWIGCEPAESRIDDSRLIAAFIG